MQSDSLELPPDKLDEICRRYGVSRLWLFGSHMRCEAGEDSDVDVLVEFLPGRTPGLAFMRLEEELGRLVGRRVDLNTPAFLSRYFRDDVIATARQIYAAR